MLRHTDKGTDTLCHTAFVEFDLVYALVYARLGMKTITLDEEAYRRLKAWKRGSGESFSAVVKRVLPEPGTLGALLNFTEAQATASLPSNPDLEAAIERARSVAKHDPWT